MKSKRRQLSAFTLIELLVVIAIIGLISTLAIVALGSARQKSRDTRRLADIKQIQMALEMYNNENGSYPVATSTILLGDSDHACLGSNGYNAAGACINQYILLPKDPSGGNYIYSGNVTDYSVSATLEGEVNDLSGVVSTQPNNGLVGINYGLVGWWKFDEGAGATVVDSSAKGNNGTWSGTQAGTNGYYSAGKIGSWAGKFNGINNYVEPSSSTILRNPRYTYSAWINLSSIPTDNNVGGVIFVTYYGIPDSGDFLSVANDGRLHLRPSVGTNWLDSVSILSTNQWYMVTATNDGALMKIYINGILDNQATTTLGTGGEGDRVFMGAWGSANIFWFPGLLDDVRVFNRSLSAAEIMSLYNSQK